MKTSRRVLIAILAIGALTAIAASGVGQGVRGDPRNTSDEYLDAVNGASCYAHHGGEGFDPMSISWETAYSQLPIGQDVLLGVKVRHNSGITQTIQSIAATVNVSQAPNVMVITASTLNNTDRTAALDLNYQETHRELVGVHQGASRVFLELRALTEPTGAALGLGGSVELDFSAPLGTTFSATGTNLVKTLELGPEELQDAGFGNYTAAVTYSSDQLNPDISAELHVIVEYKQTATEFRVVLAASEVLNAKGQSAVIPIPLRLTGPGEGVIDIRIESISYWDHQPGDGAARDDGLYYRFLTLRVRDGDQLLLLRDAAAPVPLGPSVDLYNLFTRLLGFAAAFLIPISMITGGMFGKASRRFMNRVTGGAKKRVLWHSAMSFIIIIVASVHFILALIEAKFVWSKGLLWGGIGWAVLISLGFTGYYQVRMIKRWNYRVWRHTHLWSAVGVLVFALMHTLLDGSDLGGIREWMGPWHEKLIWP